MIGCGEPTKSDSRIASARVCPRRHMPLLLVKLFVEAVRVTAITKQRGDKDEDA